MKINKDKLVRVHYRLYRGEDTSDLVEETYGNDPMEYIQGLGLLIPAFEAQLLGKEAGDAFDFVIPVDDAYGRVNPDLQMTLPKETFFVDGVFDEEMVHTGAILPMLTSDGQQIEGEVIDVWEEGVDMDFNHPLAGETLHFVGEVTEVRDPSPDELEAYTGTHHHHHHEDGDCCGGHHHHHYEDGGCCGGHHHKNGDCCGEKQEGDHCYGGHHHHYEDGQCSCHDKN